MASYMWTPSATSAFGSGTRRPCGRSSPPHGSSCPRHCPCVSSTQGVWRRRRLSRSSRWRPMRRSSLGLGKVLRRGLACCAPRSSRRAGARTRMAGARRRCRRASSRGPASTQGQLPAPRACRCRWLQRLLLFTRRRGFARMAAWRVRMSCWSGPKMAPFTAWSPRMPSLCIGWAPKLRVARLQSSPEPFLLYIGGRFESDHLRQTCWRAAAQGRGPARPCSEQLPAATAERAAAAAVTWPSRAVGDLRRSASTAASARCCISLP
mmetsp:Transcript_58576/g.169543  ORF Transcript_58576/g.169543 Transcript_58576/m.169543 type:complete len:265 (-) Transcript_58576:1164-1958(-)